MTAERIQAERLVLEIEKKKPKQEISKVTKKATGLGGLGVTYSPQDPRFAGSNPTEVDEFLHDVKILSTSPPGGTLSWGSESEISGSLKNLKPEKKVSEQNLIGVFTS